ncbi:MAG TPA: hypothetical protein VH092_19430 [Urbifossiella sp.]|jgi:hypothetical protein|nr:hypothetical protein [Urbifossiella sp.]
MSIDTSCKITNSSGKSVVVLNAFNSSTNVAQNSTKQGYLQDLTTLPLGAGGPVLADGKAGAATLNETYKDSTGKTRTSYIYDLLVSRPDSLFPVMAVGESLDFDTMGYPPVTVTKAAADNMQKALAFCQNVMTSPGSKMATGFQTAMADAFKLSTLSATEQAIAAFFNQYDAFKGLDFVSYVAVSTWLRGFAYLWGMNTNGKPGQTLYVYSAAAQGKSGTTSEGTIVFAPKGGAPSPADPADRQSGMTITLTGADGTKTALAFADGQLTDGPGAVALNCSFGFAGTFTNKDTDTTVWPILTGTMLNKPVIAIPLAPESGWDKFWSTLSFEKVLGYFLQAMGVWMALDFLKQKLTAKDKKLADDKANENKGGEPDAKQQKDAQDSGNEVGDKAQAENQNLADKVAPDDEVKVPNEGEFQQSVDGLRQEGSEAYQQVAEDNLDGGINSASGQLDELAQIENTQSIQNAEGNLVDAKTSLEGGDLKGASQGLGDVNDAIPNIVDELGTNVSTELKASIQEGLDAQNEAKEVGEEANENAEESGTGEEEPFDDPVIPDV